MTVTITWWMFPTVITLLSIAFAFWPSRSTGGYGGDIASVFSVGLAIIISLLAWLIGALFK